MYLFCLFPSFLFIILPPKVFSNAGRRVYQIYIVTVLWTWSRNSYILPASYKVYILYPLIWALWMLDCSSVAKVRVAQFRAWAQETGTFYFLSISWDGHSWNTATMCEKASNPRRSLSGAVAGSHHHLARPHEWALCLPCRALPKLLILWQQMLLLLQATKFCFVLAVVRGLSSRK